ncbi:MAG: hypothetical protein ACRDSJ_07985 [Rubrobacteraceae bacterium]
MDENSGKKFDNGREEWLSQAPKISDALRKGTSVSVTTWGGQDISGLVCDWEQTGILLDARNPDEPGYFFVPWGSVQQVRIEEVAQRRVKFLPS